MQDEVKIAKRGSNAILILRVCKVPEDKTPRFSSLLALLIIVKIDNRSRQ